MDRRKWFVSGSIMEYSKENVSNIRVCSYNS